VQQIEEKMTALYTTRNANVFRLIKQSNFKLDNWPVIVAAIQSPMKNCHTNMPSCVYVDVHPNCSLVATIHALTAATPMNLQLLSTKQHGDQFMVSGLFVKKWGGPTAAASPVLPTSPDDVEGSFSESGSMSEPEYSADITVLK
jgi:hypothetical protein